MTCSVWYFSLCLAFLLLGLRIDVILSEFKQYHCIRNKLTLVKDTSIYDKCSKVTRLIIAGNLKSGTSNMAWQLGQHPDFYRRYQKEMNCLFSESKECVLLCYDYFQSCGVKSSQVVIDASPEYERFNLTAWNSILTNDSQILFLIRKPNEWMVSMYLHEDYNDQHQLNRFHEAPVSKEEYEANFLSFLTDINSKSGLWRLPREYGARRCLRY